MHSMGSWLGRHLTMTIAGRTVDVPAGLGPGAWLALFVARRFTISTLPKGNAQ